jgi:Inner membrane component of T3SS, cytoplasmic domain
MQANCEFCGQAHLLKDEVVAKHPRVQFRCTRCSKITVIEIEQKVDETMAISPMPSFARAEASTPRLKLPPMDEGLTLPVNARVVVSVMGGPDQGSAFTLSNPRAVIGRQGADLALNDAEVSRYHCLVELRDMAIHLKDLDSTNGTFLGNERVRAAVLQNGAEFRVGSSVIRVDILGK